MKGIKTMLFVGFVSCGLSLNAQSLSSQVLANAGQVSYTENISLSWTLGESFVSTIHHNNGILTEGFHQPVLNVSPIENTLVSNKIDIQVFPNPVEATLSVKIKADSKDELTIELLDLMGRSILSKAIISPIAEFDIEMQHLPASIYVLRISDRQGNRIKTHKIAKVH